KTGQTFLEANRDQKLYYHFLGKPQSEDVLIYVRPDQPEWGIQSEVSDDGRYAILYLSHGTDPKNRIYYIDLEKQGPGSRVSGLGSEIQNPKSKIQVQGKVVKLLDDFDAHYNFLGNDGT